jgi:hypothetical protein
VPNSYTRPSVDKCDALNEHEPDWVIFKILPFLADADGCSW